MTRENKKGYQGVGVLLTNDLNFGIGYILSHSLPLGHLASAGKVTDHIGKGQPMPHTMHKEVEGAPYFTVQYTSPDYLTQQPLLWPLSVILIEVVYSFTVGIRGNLQLMAYI